MEELQKQHQDVVNSEHNKPLVIIAENLRTPENVGMVLRVAEAFAVKKVYFTGPHGIDLTTKVKRASRNTYQKIDFSFSESTLIVLEDLIKQQYEVVALEITKESIPVQEFSFADYAKVALVIGSERKGISEASLLEIPHSVHISLFGNNSSINVVSALSIALYEILRGN
ncbi:TrmH family RNA methyltransferase [Marivirga sp. S37H4]|uniref:TrmH family RNA methyltransferase n=1 Tax=Marivirga aurantiaca TaxID=2802615 RepID=A0A934X1C6_9BACT|nr:TrmH family RNA methyltransferase [Marivirga aurantiaca]MBK6266687.1 TrmH family RNA methyltransferase [Marivirga aurantiaca]